MVDNTQKSRDGSSVDWGEPPRPAPRPNRQPPNLRPTQRLHRVNREGVTAIRSPIGAAWRNKDGKGFNLNRDAPPLAGRTVLRLIERGPRRPSLLETPPLGGRFRPAGWPQPVVGIARNWRGRLLPASPCRSFYTIPTRASGRCFYPMKSCGNRLSRVEAHQSRSPRGRGPGEVAADRRALVK